MTARVAVSHDCFRSCLAVYDLFLSGVDVSYSQYNEFRKDHEHVGLLYDFTTSLPLERDALKMIRYGTVTLHRCRGSWRGRECCDESSK